MAGIRVDILMVGAFSVDCSSAPEVRIRASVSSASDFDTETRAANSLIHTKASNLNVDVSVRTDIFTEYLEINPTVLWVYPDIPRDNDVYSNLCWIVN